MTWYVALLRGINVGGKNVIRMADLTACVSAQGVDDVTTYIQSGNVLFRARGARADALTRTLERALGEAFDYRASLVLRSLAQLERTVAAAPPGFGARSDTHRCDVLFLRGPITAAAALAQLPRREGVDEAHAGPGALYVSRPIATASQSHMNRLTRLPLYQQLTVRNWNTTTTLLARLRAAAG